MNAPLAAPLLALVALIGLAVAWVSPADAGPVPDTVQIAMMQQAIADVPLVRVRGEFGARSGYKPRLDVSGVWPRRSRAPTERCDRPWRTPARSS